MRFCVKFKKIRRFLLLLFNFVCQILHKTYPCRKTYVPKITCLTTHKHWYNWEAKQPPKS